MSIYSKLHPSDSTINNKGRALTAAQFLGKDPNVKGFSIPTTFLPYLQSLRPPELEQLEQVFLFCKNGVRIIGSTVTRIDRGKRSYQHPTFLHGNSQVGCKVIVEAGMKEFLDDYKSGAIAVNFTLDELVDECMN